MYGTFTYIWLIFMVNVGKYTIHGYYGYMDAMGKKCPKNSIIRDFRTTQSYDLWSGIDGHINPVFFLQRF